MPHHGGFVDFELFGWVEACRVGMCELVRPFVVFSVGVADVWMYSCVVFDDRRGLEENLISHIKPTYYRLKYGLHIVNDLAGKGDGKLAQIQTPTNWEL